jgi:hypothetical protein
LRGREPCEVAVGADLVGQRAAVAGTVAEHHVGLLGLIEPHSYPVGETATPG